MEFLSTATEPRFPTLQPGDKVGVFAPAGPVDLARYEAGLDVLRARYQVVEAPNVRARSGFFAGSDEERLAATQALFYDPSLRALIAARGGYGTMRLLRALKLARFQLDPIPLIGFSDLTALHLAMRVRGIASVHGPVVTQLATLPAVDREALWALLEGRDKELPGSVASGTAIPLETLVASSASQIGPAPFFGGNLSLVSALVGTGYLPSTRGSILFLEDIGERPYRLDRMWMQLELAGALRHVSAIVFGDFTDCEPPRGEATPTWREVLQERCRALGTPAFLGFPAGHGERNLAFQEGGHATITMQDAERAYWHR